MFNDTEIVIKRGSARKRSRDGSGSSLTPVRKKTTSTAGQCPLTVTKIKEYLEVTPEGNALEVSYSQSTC